MQWIERVSYRQHLRFACRRGSSMPLRLLHEKQRGSCAVRYQRCKPRTAMPVIEGIRSRAEGGSRVVIGEGLVNLGQDVWGG